MLLCEKKNPTSPVRHLQYGFGSNRVVAEKVIWLCLGEMKKKRKEKIESVLSLLHPPNHRLQFFITPT